MNFRGTVILARRFVVNANLAPDQSAQVIIQRGTRYVYFFFFVSDLIFGSVHSSFSGFRFDLRSDSGFGFEKMRRLSIDNVSIASRQISLRTVRGTLVCFIRGVKVYGHMSHSSV